MVYTVGMSTVIQENIDRDGFYAALEVFNEHYSFDAIYLLNEILNETVQIDGLRRNIRSNAEKGQQTLHNAKTLPITDTDVEGVRLGGDEDVLIVSHCQDDDPRYEAPSWRDIAYNDFSNLGGFNNAVGRELADAYLYQESLEVQIEAYWYGVRQISYTDNVESRQQAAAFMMRESAKRSLGFGLMLIDHPKNQGKSAVFTATVIKNVQDVDNIRDMEGDMKVGVKQQWMLTATQRRTLLTGGAILLPGEESGLPRETYQLPEATRQALTAGLTAADIEKVAKYGFNYAAGHEDFSPDKVVPFPEAAKDLMRQQLPPYIVNDHDPLFEDLQAFTADVATDENTDTRLSVFEQYLAKFLGKVMAPMSQETRTEFLQAFQPVYERLKTVRTPVDAANQIINMSQQHCSNGGKVRILITNKVNAGGANVALGGLADEALNIEEKVSEGWTRKLSGAGNILAFPQAGNREPDRMAAVYIFRDTGSDTAVTQTVAEHIADLVELDQAVVIKTGLGSLPGRTASSPGGFGRSMVYLEIDEPVASLKELYEQHLNPAVALSRQRAEQGIILDLKDFPGLAGHVMLDDTVVRQPPREQIPAIDEQRCQQLATSLLAGYSKAPPRGVDTFASNAKAYAGSYEAQSIRQRKSDTERA